jgi:predicted RNase H-like HicB family nuclease
MAQPYLVVIEQTPNNFSAYAPDLPGVVATGKTEVQTRRRMNAAIAMHLQGLREDGLEVPPPRARAGYVTPGSPRKGARVFTGHLKRGKYTRGVDWRRRWQDRYGLMPRERREKWHRQTEDRPKERA